MQTIRDSLAPGILEIIEVPLFQGQCGMQYSYGAKLLGDAGDETGRKIGSDCRLAAELRRPGCRRTDNGRLADQQANRDWNRTMDRIDTQDVIDAVNESFAEIPYPGDDRIVYDSTGLHLECREILEKFRGKHWKSVPYEDYEFEYAAPFFMTAEGFQFYVPGFMLAAVVAFPDEMVSGVLADCLAPPPYGATSVAELERFFSRCGHFSSAQMQAVTLFLRFLMQEKPDYYGNAEYWKAMGAYWGFRPSSGSSGEEGWFPGAVIA